MRREAFGMHRMHMCFSLKQVARASGALTWMWHLLLWQSVGPQNGAMPVRERASEGGDRAKAA